MQFVLLTHKAKKRKRKTRNRNPQKNHRSQIRNEVEPSALHFWAEGSTHKLSTLTFGRTFSLFTMSPCSQMRTHGCSPFASSAHSSPQNLLTCRICPRVAQRGCSWRS